MQLAREMQGQSAILIRCVVLMIHMMVKACALTAAVSRDMVEMHASVSNYNKLAYNSYLPLNVF